MGSTIRRTTTTVCCVTVGILAGICEASALMLTVSCGTFSFILAMKMCEDAWYRGKQYLFPLGFLLAVTGISAGIAAFLERFLRMRSGWRS